MKFLFAFLLALLVAAPAMAQTTSQTAMLTLTWQDNSNNEDGFNIERRLGQTGTFAKIGSVAANVVQYVDSIANDPGNVQYCYRVAAFNTAGQSAYSNIACGTTPVIVIPPGAPSNVNVSVTVTVNVGQ